MRFTIVRKAGLNATDLSRLLQVHRCTCSLWLNGHKQPHHLHARVVQSLLDRIEKRVSRGDLPTELPRNPEERTAVLERLLKAA